MANLSKKQLGVIDGLFAGEDEQMVLGRFKVSRGVFNNWHGSEEFCVEFGRRLSALNRQSELIITRYASFAAAKLVELTESENHETSRKACLDIITLSRQSGAVEKESEVVRPEGRFAEQLSAEKASMVLAALAVAERGTSDSQVKAGG